VEDRNNYWNSIPFDFHKMIDPIEETTQEEDSQEASQEAEATQEAEDTPEEEEYHPEDHQEAVGDHHHCLCHKHTKGNW